MFLKKQKRFVTSVFFLAISLLGLVGTLYNPQPVYAAGETLLYNADNIRSIRAQSGLFQGFNNGAPITLDLGTGGPGTYTGRYVRSDGNQAWCRLNGKPSNVLILVQVTQGDILLGINNPSQPISDFRANVSFSCDSGGTPVNMPGNLTGVGFTRDGDLQDNSGTGTDVSSAEAYSFQPNSGGSTSDGRVIRACGGIWMQSADGKCTMFNYQSGAQPTAAYDSTQLVFAATLQTKNSCKAEFEITIPQADAAAAQTSSAQSVNGQIYLAKSLNDSNGLGNSACLDAGATQIQVKDIGNKDARKNITITGQLANAVFQTPAGAGDTSDLDALDCGGDDWNWLVCPFIRFAQKGASVIDGFIMQSLVFDVNPVFDTSTKTGAAYYTAWNSFRIIATAILVIGGLAMVISQALGFDFLDAYTIRKVLPRLVIAIIGISLSWPLMEFVAQFFNTLGNDIRSLMYAPFSNLGGGIDTSVGLSVVLGILVGGGIALGIGGLLSFIVTAMLAVLVGFVIIVIRQLALVVLIVVAPVAIACYILPNTEKVWKLWKDNFLGLMLMFPIISAFIAAGHIFTAVSLADSAGGTAVGASQVAQIIGIVAYFLPYFLLPLTFRIATGVIGTIAGFANDRSRGVFDRLKKGRQARVQDRVSRAKNESLWDKNSKFGRMGNKAATWATDPFSNATYYGSKIPGVRRIPGVGKRGAAIATAIEHGQVEQTGKLFEELNKMGYNDKAFRAISGVHRDLSGGARAALQQKGLLDKAPTSLRQMEDMAHILSEYGSDSEKLAGNAIHGSMGRLATLYQDQEMNKANIGGAGILGLAAHGFASSGDLATAGNNLQKQGGAAMAQSIISQAQLAGSRSRPDTKPGYGVMYDSKSKEFVDGLVGSTAVDANGKQLVGSRARAVVKSLGSHDLASAKGGAFDALEPTIREMLDTNHRDYNANEAKAVEDQLFSWAGPYSQASVDVKAKALAYIKNDAGLNARFESYRTRETDPATRNEGGPAGGDE
ncbi:hypothetical protein EYC59_00385 [Candidatus Saccharibacteria bacterium]|nr:MAG: hypothetical protein EYC59_00385 [Candidatus Saccharibacteria bacterium]